tara:strand:+ start:93 stop:338 length:246 start_codon:yes stop_codon:yes gene_type:complete
MWIKLENESVNFDNVTNYHIVSVLDRSATGKSTGDYKHHVVTIITANENEEFGGVRIKYDTYEEAKAVIKKLDNILKVVEL